MAGKGRGIAAFSFNVDALGITRGSMPESRVGPNALFPNTEFKPVPLKAGEDVDYMLALKQELRGAMKIRPHYIKPMSAKADVERYKERYLKQSLAVDDAEWTPDWNLFPKELRPQKKKPRPKPGSTKKCVKITRIESEQVLKKLDELEKKGDGKDEKSDDEKEGVEKEKKKDGEEGEEEDIDEEEYDEEDLEEENDYIDNYFDNGEEFGGGGSDDNVDGEATY